MHVSAGAQALDLPGVEVTGTRELSNSKLLKTPVFLRMGATRSATLLKSLYWVLRNELRSCAIAVVCSLNHETIFPARHISFLRHHRTLFFFETGSLIGTCGFLSH